jgi:predicted small secreted protein
MHRFCRLIFAIILAAWLLTGCSGAGTNEIQHASQSDPTSSSIFTDYGGEKPGRIHRITAADLPAPYATRPC